MKVISEEFSDLILIGNEEKFHDILIEMLQSLDNAQKTVRKAYYLFERRNDKVCISLPKQIDKVPTPNTIKTEINNMNSKYTYSGERVPLYGNSNKKFGVKISKSKTKKKVPPTNIEPKSQFLYQFPIFPLIIVASAVIINPNPKEDLIKITMKIMLII
jgi:hypothetical protein